VITFLRLLGVLNASIWFGASVFFTFFIGPAMFSESVVQVLTRPYAGVVAQVLVDRYFSLHLACGLVALGHLIGESLYLGRPFLRWSLSLLASLFVLVLVGGYGIQPKLKHLHRTMYTAGASDQDRQTAQRSFRIWHGISQALNLVVLGGVTVYLIRASRPGDATRYRI
jgi:uncharacterized membrane protein